MIATEKIVRPAPPLQEPEELFELEPIVMQTVEGSLDDRESEDLVIVAAPDILLTEHDQDSPDVLDVGVTEFENGGPSWIDNETVELDAALDVELSALSAAHDDEGLDMVSMLEVLHPMLERDVADDEDGPLEQVSATLGAMVPAFSLAESPPPPTTVIAEPRAAELFASRKDRFARHDGSTQSAARVVTVASVRDQQLIAFAFERGPGSVSVDGGESFVTEPLLQSGLCLAAQNQVLFAAVYDQPYDRCTVLERGRMGGWRRVVEFADGADDSESSLNLPVEIMILPTPVGAPASTAIMLLVRLVRGCVVVKIDPKA